MIGAFSDQSHELADIGQNSFLWDMTLMSDGSSHSSRSIRPLLGQMPMDDATPWMNVHGILMWLCWTGIGLMQIITNRYMTHHFRWRQILHSTLGGLHLVMAFFSFVIVFKMNEWMIVFNYPHAIAANPNVWLGLCLIFGGFYAKYSRDKSGDP